MNLLYHRRRHRHWVLLAIFSAIVLRGTSLFANQEINVDVCVYGGTSGGVVAAVQAARMGKSVALICVNNHLGGMTASGLGNTDVGSLGDSYIQGISREFYTRVGAKYGTSTKFTFEPHIAETVFNEMIQSTGVTVYTNQYLVSVLKPGQQLTVITMNNGNLFRAKMFIDASYEGDLLAAAGVSYTIGRESASQYGESYNGVLSPTPGNNQFNSLNVNPYLVTNDPTSGLLPLVQSGSLGALGTGDQKLQAYNYRMCLTTSSGNMLPLTAPTNYDASQYELLARYIQAMVALGTNVTLNTFMNVYPMPFAKTDINNRGPVSTDFIGQNYNYPLADYATRQQIAQAHKNYLQGFLYFLGNDSRVPATVRSQMQLYGFCKDEFADNAGWPYLMYVREARRMVSDYVMTQSNCYSQLPVPDSIGLAAYGTDSHNCQRIVVGGYAQNEGDTGTVQNPPPIPAPFPISYRSMVPKPAECSNLLVGFCISASHIAFDSMRMEPIFMILSQTTATAACLAIDDNVAVQQVNTIKLQAQLATDQQLLQWPAAANNTSSLPVINLWTTTANASRGGPKSGTMTIGRSVNTNSAVTVFFYISGTAQYGYDCQFVPNSLTIPAGVTSTNISIVPYTNALPVGDKTITLSLISSPAYTMGSLTSASVTIADTPINSWRVKFFGSNATNNAIAADSANPSGDGIPNLMKYALGLDPTIAQPGGAKLSTNFNSSTHIFSAFYTRADPLPTDVFIQMETSTNLTSWSTNLFGLSQIISVNASNVATVYYQGPLPMSNQPSEFLRTEAVRK